jgi:hypothetical protein
MSESVPARVREQELFDEFWSTLHWEPLEKRIRLALRDPGIPLVTEVNCPAVMDLGKQILGKIVDSAIQRPGEPVTKEEVFSFDQRLVILRILEAIISEYEEWKKRRFSSGAVSRIFPKFPPIEIE